MSPTTLDAGSRPAAAALKAARSPHELGTVLRALAAPAAVSAQVRALTEERCDVAPLAASSYAHPNGFDKLVLSAAPSGHKLVLHAWWPGAAPATGTGHVHDHRWSFATAVLAGGYRYVEFAEVPADAEATDLQVFKHTYASPGGDRGYELRPEGPRGLRRLRSGALRQGDVYPLDASVLHLVEIGDDDEPTVTLFLQGPPVRRSTRVFAAQQLREAGEVDLPRLSVGAYRAGLLRVLEAVGAASSAW